jgi:hypothetical protein
MTPSSTSDIGFSFRVQEILSASQICSNKSRGQLVVGVDIGSGGKVYSPKWRCRFGCGGRAVSLERVKSPSGLARGHLGY